MMTVLDDLAIPDPVPALAVQLRLAQKSAISETQIGKKFTTLSSLLKFP